MRTTEGIRIIGGKWRSRMIAVPDVTAVRPTPNRVRETLFNWLMADVQDAVCLDAFAGSGALGFEALSRGAKSVTFVDSNKEVVKQLKETAKQLATSHAEFLLANFITEFKSKQQYKIVFLDPPFHQNLIMPCLTLLLEQKLLAVNALIYLEAEAELGEFSLPTGLMLKKYNVAGEVGYYLLTNKAS